MTSTWGRPPSCIGGPPDHPASHHPTNVLALPNGSTERRRRSLTHGARTASLTLTPSRWIAGVRRDSSWAVSVVVLANIRAQPSHGHRSCCHATGIGARLHGCFRDRMGCGGARRSKRDASALASFYSQLLGWAVVHEEPGTAVVAAPEGAIYIVFQQTSDYQRPVWPPQDGRQRPMMHFDFQVAELDSAVAEALTLGATVADHQPQENVRCAVRSRWTSVLPLPRHGVSGWRCPGRVLPLPSRAGADRFRAIPHWETAPLMFSFLDPDGNRYYVTEATDPGT